MQEPLAIVGMSCRLPGADGLNAFWDLISKGNVAWGKLPEEKLPRDLYFHPEKNQRGKSYSELGSLVPGRRVDEANCPITDQMRHHYDEAHHLFLEVASLACRDAGLDPFAMPGGIRTGVYLGHTGGSSRMGDMVYATGIDQTAPIFSDLPEAVNVLGVESNSVADEVTRLVRDRYPGRQPNETLDTQALGGAKIVHEALKLEGPYLVVDAACASSLQALAIGARSLLAGGVDQAIVGGASYYKSDSLVLFSAAQSVSNNGSCPFGQEADGLVTAEGYVALVIKTLSRAVADGDRVRAVIRGLGISSDGRGRSLWAPRSEGQVLAVERAYPDLKKLAEVDYIEAHATSTQVGDATELGALASLVSKNIPAGHQIPIGSVKANIGHTLETAGLASLVKVVLAMEHAQIPPSSTCKTPNEDFDWQDGPFKLLRSLTPWDRTTDTVRTAAVNAFGIGGLNVHVALCEHQPVEAPRATQRTSPEPVAIVGAGCVMPDALDRDAFFALLDSGRSAIGPVPKDRWDAERGVNASGPQTHHTTSAQGGFIRGFEYDWRRHKVPPKQIAAANPLQFMLLEAADSALADAGMAEKGFDRKRTGVIVGTMFGGEFTNQLQMGLRLPETGRILRRLLEDRGVTSRDIDQIVAAYEENLLDKMPALVDETGSFTSSTLASRLTKTFDLMGGALAFDAGKCSGVMAVTAALDMLRSGENDIVLCAAGDRYLDLAAFEDLSLVSRLAGQPRSPNGTVHGLVPGEGAVVLVLKRLSDAVAAGDPIRGVIRGAAMEAARTPHEAMRNAVGEASRQAGTAAELVGAVEISGSGDLRQEQQLLEVLTSAYAGNAKDKNNVAPACGSLDGVVGHCGSAAGAAGVLKMTHALKHGVMPVNVGSGTDTTGGHLQVSPQQALPIPAADANGYRAAAVTVADGQQVGHLILDNGKPLPKKSSLKPAVQHTRPAQVPQVQVPQNQGPQASRVAALFPGQGSQYTDMFRDLVAASPEARAAMDRVDQLATQLGNETLSDVAWKRDNLLGIGVWETQWAMYLGDLFAWEVLRDMGMRVDVIASHSFGEFPSLAAAGAWSAEVGARAARCRGDAVEHVGPKDGAMLSVLASRQDIENILTPFENRVFICAENSFDQVVVGGHRQDVDAVEEVLESKRIHFKRLAVPCPYHTPLLAASSSELSVGIGYLPINAPQIPVYSSTTASHLKDSSGIRESLTRQMTETVQWVRVVERLYAEGIRTFVEVGPLGVLSGLVRRVLKGKTDIQLIQFDQKSEAASEVMARLRSQLAAAGAIQQQGQQEQEVIRQEQSLGVVMQHEEQQREKQEVIAFDATGKRRARNRAGGKAKPVTPVKSVTPAKVAQKQSVQQMQPATSAVTQQAEAIHVPSSQSIANGNGNGHVSQSAVSEQRQQRSVTAQAAQGVSAGSRKRPTGEGDSLVDILSRMYKEHGVVPPLAESPAGAVDRFWRALAEMFDLSAADRESVMGAADSEALVRLLSGAGGKAEWLDATPTASSKTASPKEVPSASPTPAAPVSLDNGQVAADIEAFLIDFVVEQTGYPAEIVELDVDLEADLGIDSIRKAQMMGEVGQKYGLEADATMSLDDFPTLRHLLDYIVPRIAGGGDEALDGDLQSQAPTDAQHRQSSQSNGEHTGNGHAAVAADPMTTAAYQAGFEVGRTHAEAIQQWSRSVAQSVSDRTIDCVLEDTLQEKLKGIAEAAKVEVALLTAAVADPTRVVGNCDLLLDLPSPESSAVDRVRGFAMSFTRHIQMDHVRFQENNLSGCLVTATGMPGAVVGWNDAGIVAILGPCKTDESPISPGMPAGQVIQQIAQRCRSFSDVQQTIDRGDLERPPAGMSVLVADLSNGGIREITPQGEIHDRGHQLVCRGRISPLTRILTEGHSQTPSQAISEIAGQNSAATLSAACSWLAVTVEGQHATVSAGSPTGKVLCGPDFELPCPSIASESTKMMPEPLQALSNPVTSRYLLAMRPIGEPQTARTLKGERVLLMGNSLLAEPLSQAIHAAGGQVEIAECSNCDQAIAVITAAESRGPLHHLVIVDRDPAGDKMTWPNKKESWVQPLFFAVQKWLSLREAADDLASSSLTALVNLGGDFGRSGHIAQVEGGAICGLYKNLNREYPEVYMRVVDAVTDLPSQSLCERFVAEMCDAAGPVEVGLLTRGRQVAAVTEEALAKSVAGLPEALRQGSVWIVTGGARGVTAACAQQLASRYGVKLALVGSTQPAQIDPSWIAFDEAELKKLKGETMVAAKKRGEDPRSVWGKIEKSLEIHRSLSKLTAAGADAHYEVCDLSNAAQVKELVGRVTQKYGPVQGLIHGAGYEASCRFSKKTPEGLSATLGPKCDGLAHLLNATESSPLSQLVAFGSTSGRFGGHGQADYSAANDLLAKQIADARRRKGLAATVIHWHAWGGAGMANRPESRFVLEQFGLQFMPLEEGATRLLAELEAGLPQAEVVITEPKMCEGAIDWPEADRQVASENHLTQSAPNAKNVSGSLVAEIESAQSVTFELNPMQDCFLLEHKQLGRPLLPAVMGLELMSQAAIAAGQVSAVREIRDFKVSRPASFSSDNERTFRVAMHEAENGLAAELMARHMRPDGRVADKEREHMGCKVFAEHSTGDLVPLGDRLFPFNPMVYQDEAPMWHGPAFRTLKGLFYERSGGWGKLLAPDMNILAAPRDAAGWTIPAALLDGCIVAAAVYSYLMLGKRVDIPMGFDRLRLYELPESGEECAVRVLYRSHTDSETRYDFTLYGADERVLLSVDGLHLSVFMQGRV